MRCRQCGREVPAGKAFCAGCGAATGTAGPTTRGREPASKRAHQAAGPSAPARSRGPASAPKPARGLSVWWIIIPTVLFAVLSLNVRTTVAVAVLGLVLRLAQGWPGLPAGARPYLPLVQPVAVFLGLGGDIILVAVVGVLGAVTVHQRDVLVPALEPWWRIQQSLPRGRRYVLALVFTMAIGFLVGGIERGYVVAKTCASVTVGTVVAFLFTFDPPPALRRRRGAGPARGRA